MKIEMEINDGKIVITDESIKELKKCYPGWQLNDTSSKCGFVPDAFENEKLKIETPKTNESTIQTKVNEEFQKIVNETYSDKETDEVNPKLSNPTRFNTGQTAITMSTIDKPDIDQIADIDKDIVGYDRIRVFDSMDRRADVTVINYGSTEGLGELYITINRNGIDHDEEQWSQNELYINPGAAFKIFDVYELRIRSDTQGAKYQITEDEFVASSIVQSVM